MFRKVGRKAGRGSFLSIHIEKINGMRFCSILRAQELVTFYDVV